MRGLAYHNPGHDEDDDDDIVRTLEQREQMSSQMTELLLSRVGTLHNVIAETKRTLQEDVNPTSSITSGATNKSMSIARRLAVEHTLGTTAEDAHEQRKERALQRLPWTRVVTYQMLFTERAPKRKVRARQPSSATSATAVGVNNGQLPSGSSVSGATSDNKRTNGRRGTVQSHRESSHRIMMLVSEPTDQLKQSQLVDGQHFSSDRPQTSETVATGNVLGVAANTKDTMLFWYGEDKKIRKIELEKELHLLAESHVTRSVDNTARVLLTNEPEKPSRSGVRKSKRNKKSFPENQHGDDDDISSILEVDSNLTMGERANKNQGANRVDEQDNDNNSEGSSIDDALSNYLDADVEQPDHFETGSMDGSSTQAQAQRTTVRSPMDVHPRLLIAYVLTTIQVDAKENIDHSMAVVLQCETVIKIVETMFWYVHAGAFQRNSLDGLQGTVEPTRSNNAMSVQGITSELRYLESTLAALYVRLLAEIQNIVNHAKVDTMYKYLPYAIAQAIITGFRYLCPGSRHLYTFKLKTQVFRTCCDTLLGFAVCDVTLQAMRNTLFPEEAMGNLLKGSGNSETENIGKEKETNKNNNNIIEPSNRSMKSLKPVNGEGGANTESEPNGEDQGQQHGQPKNQKLTGDQDDDSEHGGNGSKRRLSEGSVLSAPGGLDTMSYSEIAQALQLPAEPKALEMSKRMGSMRQTRVKFDGKLQGSLVSTFLAHTQVGHLPRRSLSAVHPGVEVLIPPLATAQSSFARPKSQQQANGAGSRHGSGNNQRKVLSPINVGTLKPRPGTSSAGSFKLADGMSSEWDYCSDNFNIESNNNRQRPHTTQAHSRSRNKDLGNYPPLAIQLPTTNLLTRTIPSPSCRVGTSSTFRSRHGVELGKIHKGLLHDFQENKKQASNQAQRFQSKLHSELRKVDNLRDEVLSGGVEDVSRFCLDLINDKYTARVSREDENSMNSQTKALIWQNNLDIRKPPCERFLHAIHKMNNAQKAEMRKNHTTAKTILSTSR